MLSLPRSSQQASAHQHALFPTQARSFPELHTYPSVAPYSKLEAGHVV